MLLSGRRSWFTCRRGGRGHGASSHEVMTAESPSGGPLCSTGVSEAGEAAAMEDWGERSAKGEAYFVIPR